MGRAIAEGSAIEGYMMDARWAGVVQRSGVNHLKRLVFVRNVVDDIVSSRHIEDGMAIIAGQHKAWDAAVGLLLTMDPKGVAYVWALTAVSRNASFESSVCTYSCFH